jgi:hypothetical protein
VEPGATWLAGRLRRHRTASERALVERGPELIDVPREAFRRPLSGSKWAGLDAPRSAPKRGPP